MRACTTAVLMVMCVGVSHDGTAQGLRGASPLRVGAARVDVTPSEGELPKNSYGILDRLYARAIVLENGTSSAALITVDAGSVPDAIWQTVTRQIEAELGIRPANVLLTAPTPTVPGGSAARITRRKSSNRSGSRNRS